MLYCVNKKEIVNNDNDNNNDNNNITAVCNSSLF